MNTAFYNRPCAAKGLVSYRYMGRFGWIMIGAKDDADALREAERSIHPDKPHIANLQKWTKHGYLPIETL